MARQVKKLKNTPFDDVFRTLLEKCNKLIIPVINEIFHTDYSLKEEVLVLANEQFFIDEDGGDLKRVTDSYLRIRDNIYHIECQSTDDAYMEIRMMEYDFHIALDNVTYADGIRTVKLPQSAVLVIRNKNKYPDVLEAYLQIPKTSPQGTIYETVEYTVPTCKVGDYTKDDIINKNLIFLAPYYIMKFEEKLDEINSDVDKLNELKAEYQEIYNRIAELSNQDELEPNYLFDVVCLTEKLIDIVAEGKENIRREVTMLGGNVLKLDREIWEEEAMERGEKRGEDRMSQLIYKLHMSGRDADIIKVSTDEEYRKEMYKEYNI